MSSPQLKVFTRDEVAKWIIIDAKVYDVTRFKALHPGGLAVLLEEDVAGCDTTEAFFGLHRYEVLEKPQFKRLQIGTIEGETSQLHGRVVGALSLVPYAEPTWLSPSYHSPYYTESHRTFQKAIREFCDEYIYPDALVREEDGKRPTQSVIDKMAETNINAMRMGPGKHLKGLVLMGGIVKPEEFDYFHELIITQELARTCLRGYADGEWYAVLGVRIMLTSSCVTQGLVGGMVIGLPPVLNFGSDELKARILPEVFSGKKFICLAISEAHAGSDVMGLRTTAVKSDDGKHWIINGTKKWITNGTFADYFTVGCKTEDGFTVIFVERGPGVETKPIKTSYSSSAGTAYITFDNVKVPIENTLGEEGAGLFVILSNFNHERFVMCCASARSQRIIIEEALHWVNQRKVFGKPLHSQAVIRSKLAAMISRAESCQAWLENIAHQMCNMSYKQQSRLLAGITAPSHLMPFLEARKMYSLTWVFGKR
ncbi:hypothetical protein EST38_g1586 [Candolleomyces aberdarensis]|uniref:Cytochrome b5 heme-binding domain-containing protein n=1 Tax=Candolleomyces aberdarensis TaxID=2316362 RepID=A0A4Q2DVQ3_9AGAR|nr:hypothetical protein EST38_g1586 [Candolleomyces aberdarensis]